MYFTSSERVLAAPIPTSAPILSIASIKASYSKAVFAFTRHVQTFVVPSNTYTVYAEVYGASGGTGNNFAPGYGGYVFSALAVTPGQTLHVVVGGCGNHGAGYNGGGLGTCNGGISSGGGATDIRTDPTSLSSRLVVGGGGVLLSRVFPLISC